MLDISKREKNILTAGIVFLVVFFGYRLGIAPVFEKRQILERSVTEKQASLTLMNTQLERILSLNRQSDFQTRALMQRPADFSLFSFIDSQAQQSGVKENVDYMKPFTRKDETSSYQVATVKISLKEVNLKALVDFLDRIESSKNAVIITSLSLAKAGKQKNKLDAVLETETLMPGSKA
ncbi:MAG: type II secretion system protein M [Proteobacteria bacterium]|nr:type II secretion system protein M [Pseudomonadota bacterium]MBU1388660.1 type II secretion system protein M [Pseudomonadota bacterium]MBU1544871.1 type II secretion system protein M [Pseudomonadota bacterium]MBU2431478.1 type II secretion system protein M [Pseudomonadota bacterium]MBU2482037.1 type II secretion system protein M [Pseudomonadota bacterium]